MIISLVTDIGQDKIKREEYWLNFYRISIKIIKAEYFADDEE